MSTNRKVPFSQRAIQFFGWLFSAPRIYFVSIATVAGVAGIIIALVFSGRGPGPGPDDDPLYPCNAVASRWGRGRKDNIPIRKTTRKAMMNALDMRINAFLDDKDADVESMESLGIHDGTLVIFETQGEKPEDSLVSVGHPNWENQLRSLVGLNTYRPVNSPLRVRISGASHIDTCTSRIDYLALQLVQEL
jgi:hypothetical protein